MLFFIQANIKKINLYKIISSYCEYIINNLIPISFLHAKHASITPQLFFHIRIFYRTFSCMILVNHSLIHMHILFRMLQSL